MTQCHKELSFSSPEMLTASVLLNPDEPTDVSKLIKRQVSFRGQAGSSSNAYM